MSVFGRYNLMFFLAWSVFSLGVAQQHIIDSLRMRVRNAPNDSIKGVFQCKIGKEFWYINADSSSFYTNAAKEIAVTKNINGLLPYCFNNYGVLEYLQGNYSNALKNYFEGLKFANSNLVMKGILMNNIGMNYTDLRDFQKAQEYYQKTLNVKKEMGDSSRLATTYNNIGVIFNSLRKYDIAKRYFDTTLYFAQKFPDYYTEADALGNTANFYFRNKNFKEAERYCRKAYIIKKELQDTYGCATSASDLAAILMATNQFALAEASLAEGEEIAIKNNYHEALLPIYQNYSQIYEKKGDYKRALFYINKTINLKDTLLADGKLREAAVKEKEYSFEIIQVKDSLQNEFQKNETKLLHDKQLYRQKLVSYGVIIALVCVLLIVVFIYRAYNEKKKSHLIISEQKKEVELQKQIIEEHQKETIDSINYAKKIQYALLAHDSLLKKHLPEHFVLFKPKDIVSGDFYWATEHNNRFYLAVCDSTGHGVPGAFMSLLNIGFLSEAIKEKSIIQPNEILDYVRKRLIESIGGDGQQDGMDAILICIDNNSELKPISYAAANNAPILVIKSNLQPEIIDLPKDKMPVGKGERMQPFSLHQISAHKGDVLYLYTDGFADQFGGPKGKKYKYKQLNELLVNSSNKDVCVQLELLSSEFENWRGNLEQVDDVLLVGIRF
jgi:serine phosphatase RsbU (regulator of sigma subunit)